MEKKWGVGVFEAYVEQNQHPSFLSAHVLQEAQAHPFSEEEVSCGRGFVGFCCGGEVEEKWE